jgi:hypothetical protein
MKTQIHITLIILLSYVFAMMLCGCSTPIPDSSVCVEMDINRARCTTIMTGKNFTIDDMHLFGGKTYWEMRPQMILVPAQSWAEIKEFILKICNQSHMCSDNVGNWQTTVGTLQDELDSKELP